jgi:hypothetical protein
MKKPPPGSSQHTIRQSAISGTVYALFDGLFLRALHGLLRGAPDAAAELIAGARFLLTGLVQPDTAQVAT